MLRHLELVDISKQLHYMVCMYYAEVMEVCGVYSSELKILLLIKRCGQGQL